MKNIKNKKGFTLIELIVVIAILGILMLILVPSFLGYAEDAKEQVVKANTRTLWTAAKATETQAEYMTKITNATFKATVMEKIGETFDGEKVEVDLVEGKTKVISVSYKACTTLDGENYDGVDCPKD